MSWPLRFETNPVTPPELPETKMGKTCCPMVVRTSAIFIIVSGSGRPGMAGKPAFVCTAPSAVASAEDSGERRRRLRDSLDSSWVSSDEESSSSDLAGGGSSCFYNTYMCVCTVFVSFCLF